MSRRLPTILLLLSALACSRDRRDDAGAEARGVRAEVTRGPDPVLIRMARGGGAARAYVYPRLDSVVWTGHTTSIDRVLGFDPEGGTLAIVDTKGEPARIDLRSGEGGIASKVHLASLGASAAADIFGIDPKGAIVRVTRAGTWTFNPPTPAREVFPQPDGSAIIAAAHGTGTIVWKVHPPDTIIRDTVILDIPLHGASAQVGDRVYFATDTALVGVRTRDLGVMPSIHVKSRVLALVPTPSGDRIYVALADASSLAVVDRYTDKVATTIDLPGAVSDLRMDRLGRYVIARPMLGDSAWVVAIATNRVVGSVHTRWTDDLPTIAPDGAVAINTGRDVVFLDGETLQSVRTVAGGAADYWYFTFWNGFRARAAGMDQPVSFARADTSHADTAALAADSAAAKIDSVPKPATPVTQPPAQAAAITRAIAPAVIPQSVASAAAPAPAPQTSAAVAAGPFTVQFAAYLADDKARALADSVQVDGGKARVVPAQRAGTTIFRVVLGPYPTKAAAEQVGRDSKRSFWVFPGQP